MGVSFIDWLSGYGGQFHRLVVWIWGSVLLTGCLDMGVSFIDWLSGYGGQFHRLVVWIWGSVS